MRPIRPLLAALLFTWAVTALAATSPPASADQVKKLIAVLKSDAGEKEKADACRELARIGNKDAVAPLAALLPDEKLSHMARYGLEAIPGSAVDKALREAAGKLHGRQLVGVIGSIGVRRDPKAVNLLARLLQSPDREVAQASARSLGSIGNETAAEALLKALPDVSPANQLAFCEGLLRCAESATARGKREDALEIYDRLREVPAPHQVQTAALRGSILTRKEAGLSLLRRALHADEFSVVMAAIRTSQEIPGREVTRLLASEMDGLPADRQVLLIQTLARRGDDVALPALYAAARSGDQPVRLEAIRALAQIGSPSATPVLVELLGDADRQIAQSSQESLAALPSKEVDAAILSMLSNGATPRRVMAMELAVRRRMASAVPVLFEIAAGTDARLRVAAVQKLGELAGPDQIPNLLDLLAKASDSADLEATEQALSAVSLRAPSTASAVSLLEARLSQASAAQKCALLRVLGAVGGPPALQAVRVAVNDANAQVHTAAIRILGGWSTPDAADVLFEVVKASSEPADKMISLRGYLRLAGQSELPVDKRLAMCRQAAPLTQNDDEKKLLLGALGSIPSVDALELIVPYLDDAAIKEEAASGALSVSDKLLQGPDSAKVAPRIVGSVEKVAQATASPDLAKRAKALCDQAKAKAAGK